MLRSALAILLGLVTAAVLGGVGVYLAAWLLPAAVSEGVVPRYPPMYLMAFVLINALASAAGGAVTGLTAPRSPFTHVAMVAGIVLLWSLSKVISAAVPLTDDVLWFALADAFLAALAVLLGGRLQPRR